jgi:acetoin utilization deacetylase AcuC-like enzyme
MSIFADGGRIAVPEVWSNDPVCVQAIERNRKVHPKTVAVIPSDTDSAAARRVGLLLDDNKGIMAAHQPFDQMEFALAAKSDALTKEPGCLSTFKSAISSNERPERIVAATSFLNESGVACRCIAIAGRDATSEELLRVHSEDHCHAMLACQLCAERGETTEILRTSTKFNTVFMNNYSVAAALYAAGGTIEATRAVVSGDLESAVAVVRPPGHHSECGCAMGFGIFNSVAIAAADALASGLERVLIVDWDIHHGNGTQGHFEHCLQYV